MHRHQRRGLPASIMISPRPILSPAEAAVAMERLLQRKGMDPHTYWEGVVALHWGADPAWLPLVLELSQRKDARARQLAAEVLGQFGPKKRILQGRCRRRLAGMLANESRATVLEAVILGLNFQDYVSPVLEEVLRHAGHPSPLVRYAVGWALFGLRDPRAVPVLLRLVRDPVAEVRDAAMFALESHSRATLRAPAVLAALLAGVEDPDSDVVSEAAAGLARIRHPEGLRAAARQLREGFRGSVYDDILREYSDTAVRKMLDDIGLSAKVAAVQRPEESWRDAVDRVVTDLENQSLTGSMRRKG